MTQASPTAWHTLDAQVACRTLGTAGHGLSEVEAAERLARFGPNNVPYAPPPAWWQIFGRQVRNPIIYILAVAAVVSVAIGHLTDAAFITGVVVINSLIGGIQEFRAARSARALQQMLRTRAFAHRDGEVVEIAVEDVVPGDVVWLESGNRIPADLRILGARGLEIDESLLTGESIPVGKDPEAVLPEDTSVGDRRNMAYAGTVVVRGRARGLVAETGSGTQIGRLALEVMRADAGDPPLLIRLHRFTRVVGVAVLVVALLIGIAGVVFQGQGVGEMFMFAVALAVSAIPEGLPIAITVALAIAAARMARRGVIVRRLGAVEGLGSCTLIASDKTGTLTCNELTVREIVLADGMALTVSGQGFAPVGTVTTGDGVVAERGEIGLLDALAQCVVLCNEADLHQRDERWSWRGDPTDVALLSMAHKLAWMREVTLEKHPQISQIPFEPELRYAASFHRTDDGPRVYVKGAPERVLSMCDDGGGNAVPLADALRLAEAMAGRGFRVLAVADGPAPADLEPDHAAPEPSGLRLLGFVGMIDPLRPGAKEAVQTCVAAGISTSMVTGDHPTTALAIARDLGFAESEDQVLTSSTLAVLEPGELERRVAMTRVFARVAPEQKLEIVHAAQETGHFVAVTGDGANDAPALRAANIGVAMGRSGTDVARESSDLVISDDNFATIVAGVEEGRIAYDNIRKVTFLLVSTGAAEVILVVLAVITGSPLPLLPAQLLWLNLVTNGIQDVALAFEKGEEDVLQRRPRSPRERIFNRLMIENCLLSATVMGVLGFTAFTWMLEAGWSEHSARNGLLLLMVLFENVQIGNCRSETRSAFAISPLRSPLLLGGAIVAFLAHLVVMNGPIGARILGTEPVGIDTFLSLLGIALVLLVAVELQKLIRRRRSGRTPPPQAPSA
jgi:magnesium-transporting ATPase (P-type)